MSFDRVAGIYDATRALPADVVERVADRIVAATNANPATQFVELGIGTGRIALPLIRRGFPYIGVDISTEMMARLREKVGEDVANLTLIQGDITDLPLPDDSADVVLTVHVLHLVPEWEQAVKEARRVLRPDGYFVAAYDGSTPGGMGGVLRAQWRAFVEETGTELRPDYGTRDSLDVLLTEQGARTTVYQVAHWERTFPPIELLEEQRNRTHSLSWSVPEDVLIAVHERMLAWAGERYGDLEKPVSTGWESLVSVSRFAE